MIKRIEKFRDNLSTGKVFILDGAMGTEISARGIKTTLPLWSAGSLLTNPQTVKQIHKDYINAGARIIITNTFRTTRRTFKKKNMADKAKQTTLLACKLAKEAVSESGQDVLVAGSMAPLEDCYRPDLVPDDRELKKEHLEYAENLKEGGVDFLLAETMISLREIKAVCKAAKQVGLPLAISFCCDKDGNLLSGEKLEKVVKLVEQYNPIFLSLNCMSLDLSSKVLKKLRKSTYLPIAVYAQGDGEASDDQGWKFKGNNRPKIYSKYAEKWIKSGADVIGGCCGTNPEYIHKLTNSVSAMVQNPPKRKVFFCL